jgi:hypothetical protein
MRGVAVMLVVGCGGGVPSAPATLAEPVRITQITPDNPATFDVNNNLVVMDSGSGIRRLVGNRLDVIPGTGAFNFGRFGTDRDGTLLLGSLSTFQLARLEASDQVAFINLQAPTSFDRIAGTPSGAYWLTPLGGGMSFTLPASGTAWVQSTRLLDRVLWTPDSMFAIENGDVVRLAGDDSPQIVASCAEFAGGTCPELELAGVDGQGAIHMARSLDQEVHILDPGTGIYREVALPGELTIVELVAGLQYTMVLANDPDRMERSLWMLASGDDELLRFAAVPQGQFGGQPHVLMDHAGNGYLVVDDNLQAVVLD